MSMKDQELEVMSAFSVQGCTWGMSAKVLFLRTPADGVWRRVEGGLGDRGVCQRVV